MVSNQVLGARAAATLAVLAIAISGCSHLRRTPEPTAAPAPVASVAPAATATAAPDMTATEAGIAAAGSPAASATDAPAVVNPTAPKHYTVKRGDTLWGIASTFLRDPWLWPEVWIINPQVPNPHLIYPGDTLALAYGADGRPQVSLEQAGTVRLDPRLRSSALDSAIPTVPYAAIAAFLSRPTLLTADQIRSAPYVLAFRDMHQIAGSGNEVYVRNLTAEENSRFSVMHVSDQLRDPDDGAVLGYVGIYTATALVQRSGNPAKALLIDPARETLQGDRLLTADQQEPANFVIRAPAGEVHGRILAVVNGTELVGQYNIVAINRGSRHGLAPGTVLAVDAAGDTTIDLYRGGKNIGDSTNGVGTSFAPRVKLPDERAGTALVFKVFDRVSYALIVGASDAIHNGDVVHNP
ncbi:MAG: LysM peptidoglycan-binding domain-containing protein [Steroidobacterales bacterium]|jgi:LysM repeat protein